MRKKFLYLLFFAGLIACKEQPVFKLKGRSDEPLRNKTVGLSYPTAPGRQYFLTATADSCGYFSMTSEITPGKVAFLNFGFQHLPFYMEQQAYQVKKANGHYYVVSEETASLQNQYVRYMRHIDSLDAAYNRLSRGYDTIADLDLKAGLSDRMKESFARRNDEVIRGIKQFAGTEIALNIVNELMYLCEVDYRFFSRAMEALGDSLPESDLKNKILKDFKAAQARQLTGKAPAFSLSDIRGKVYTLEDFRGKYLLLDFWASWCAPCRAKNKELNKCYQELNELGLNVVSVSLDDDRNKWLKAVREDQISWLQLADLDGFKNSKVREAYKVRQVPTVYLISPEGEVLITGPSLEEIRKTVK